ncbi:hypothetical protein BU25DRAFT_133630 [Macroventuria anomochaeta]|uniref:Uncharacterized protein n=1 Tax=Macroventuria anomochaeta TaxID=301207 RepID=A0ACB6RV49_9PLEO|nr:uncharacterized protein BU25DRAFT_133630 [Macroventuria anomochaeta]KAF2624757.1 hypothetical protein BU25DRAFT_133630 [Macroventuria anomochaeta]
MQNLFLWFMRDIVRGVEKGRSLPIRGLQGFLPMHEAVRPAINAFEILRVSVQTVEVMHLNLVHVSNRNKQASRLQPHMEFQVQMLRNLLLRSPSNKERLQNENDWVHNMIAQQDSQAMTGLGEAAKRDSGAVKTIAVVTMASLPPTFLSGPSSHKVPRYTNTNQAIFSMNFSDDSPAPDTMGWSVSDKFWVYWACAVPLTCLMLAIWFWGQRLSGARSQ